jgi:hypothetical protein
MLDTREYETKEQRLELYRDAIKMIKNNPGWCGGLCYVMKNLGINVYTIDNFNNFKHKLPELYEQKPKACDGCYWWETGEWEPRLDALGRAIELIEKS